VPVEPETRISFSALDRSNGAQFRFVLPGAELAETEWRACLDRLEELAPDWIVASGSLPPGVPEDFYARVAALARQRGARLALDTSGAALQAALGPGVHLVKPNLRELADLTGRALEEAADWRDAAAELAAAGQAAAIALTLGHQGGLLATAGGCWRAPAVKVDTAASAIGAGDSFLAAMVWRLAAGADLADAFRWGMAAGAAALITPATELCRKEDVERLQPQVTLTAC
jgi:6-phosphofructokinase 2